MGLLTSSSSSSFLNVAQADSSLSSLANYAATVAAAAGSSPSPHSSHPDIWHLILLVFEAVLEVVCVSLPGYIIARMGMFDAEAQKFLANLNVMLFTPCLIFTKLASQLTPNKLTELAIIPAIFIVQTLVSYLCGVITSRCFRLKKRQSNFVVAMGVFGNSNSLPISLVISLAKTLKGLHWDRIPDDTDEQVTARGILYLLIFQQLGQLVRWTWGYRVLLAPKESYIKDVDDEESGDSQIPRHQTRYTDHSPTNSGTVTPVPSSSSTESGNFDSGAQTPVGDHEASPFLKLPSINGSDDDYVDYDGPDLPPPGEFLPHQGSRDLITFPSMETRNDSFSPRWRREPTRGLRRVLTSASSTVSEACSRWSNRAFTSLPLQAQKFLSPIGHFSKRFVLGVWGFMSPPLWAMGVAFIVASVPALQRFFFTPGTFINNSVTHAIQQSGGVAVPLILVVLGANLARNTLPDVTAEEHEHPREERNLIIASLLARMLLPILIMGPIIAVIAKFVPVSLLDDPIFIIVCFLLLGAPSALQLAQICQINNVYMGAMSKILFQSYVVWILPSTLVLVMCALEVVEWATA
ncbi:hypothetical protein AJ80_01831 [Polytolypa hystricis UAMH7299]|uniref:Auxin efflux carrier n=1 Tax=Polytolypa hystricis (strain UAMH7299) TaxID=1447883 RepID=A0A2B7Z109_POLH7|nr:hypothetical protein AJ80_01831 [Polytolypa hystricis UAMH7299]